VRRKDTQLSLGATSAAGGARYGPAGGAGTHQFFEIAPACGTMEFIHWHTRKPFTLACLPSDKALSIARPCGADKLSKLLHDCLGTEPPEVRCPSSAGQGRLLDYRGVSMNLRASRSACGDQLTTT
jgi:hypothetical protein